MERREIAKSPNGAEICIAAAAADHQLCVTLHAHGSHSLYNLWIRTGDEWQRLIPESISEGEPNLDSLAASYNLMAFQPEFIEVLGDEVIQEDILELSAQIRDRLQER